MQRRCLPRHVVQVLNRKKDRKNRTQHAVCFLSRLSSSCLPLNHNPGDQLSTEIQIFLHHLKTLYASKNCFFTYDFI